MRMVNNLHAEKIKFITGLRNLVESSAELYGDKVLYRYIENSQEKTFTYNDMLHTTESIGTALLKLGFTDDAHIAIVGETHPYYIASYIATVGCNFTVVPLDKELTPEQIAGFIDLANVKAVFYSASVQKKIDEIVQITSNVSYFFPFQTIEEARENVVPVPELVKIGAAELQNGNRTYLDMLPDMQKCCAILFTSGTTGTSKGVMLSQHNLTAAINSSDQSMSYDHNNRFVSVLPPHHTYEMTCAEFGIMNLGAEIFINDSIKHVMKNFASYKPDALALVPLFVETMHKKIWDEIRRRGMEKKVRAAMKMNALLLDMGIDIRKKLFGKITAAFGGELKSIVCGGAPISPEIIVDFYHFGITVLEGYGITECAPLVAVNSPGKVRFHSVGQPVYGCQVKIDYDPGQTTGEILVKGENVMLGYFNNPEATAEVFTEDGYFRTGDIGYMSKDGYVFITGRKKNVIILSNGKNVFPEELEEYLSKVPEINESVVVGRKNENANSSDIAITAIVVPNMEHPSLVGKTPAEVYSVIYDAITAINRKTPSFKHITALEIRYEPFEKNTSQKIKRYKIK